jgi:RNase adaptor protein for sRNA GlmZ degradation
MPQETRNELLELYLDELSKTIAINKAEFKKYYYAFVLIRILQALGSYGYRGFYERKPHFLQSIPYALQNLRWLFDNVTFPVEIKELINVLTAMIDSADLKEIATQSDHQLTLTVSIHSFSYRKGMPHDFTGNGGGHVFDCRILSNPGKEPKYQNLTGCDNEIETYLNNLPETEMFFNHIKGIVSQSVSRYMERGFNNLMVSFGCTGGQHRSVYCAEHIAAFLRKQFPNIRVLIYHHEQKHLNNRI